MDTFTDYYAMLGVDADTSAGKIKAAFKKLALQSLRVSRYVTKLVHTTMVTALSAHPMNSSHFVPIVAARAGALPKMPV